MQRKYCWRVSKPDKWWKDVEADSMEVTQTGAAIFKDEDGLILDVFPPGEYKNIELIATNQSPGDTYGDATKAVVA